MTKRNLASALSFAHLAGVSAAKAEDDKEDDKKKDDAAAAEDKAGDEDEGDDKDKKDGKKGKAASEEDDEEEMSASDDNDDDKDEKDSKKAAVAKAVIAERSRCAKILGARVAARNLPLACHLAFNTAMSASAAIAALSDASVAALPSRHNPNLGPNGGPSPDSRQGLAQSWDRAFTKTAKTSRK